MEFDVDKLLTDTSFPAEPIHVSLGIAETTGELTLVQFALLCLLRLEGAILLRRAHLDTENEWYKMRLNDFSYWDACQGSMATNHGMQFTSDKEIQYSLRQYLELDSSIFKDPDDVLASTDARKLLILANHYSDWLGKSMPGNNQHEN